MEYELYDQDGKLVNTIVSEENFVAQYASSMGYTYKQCVRKAEPTVADLQVENQTLRTQLQAVSDRADFLDDCVAEMATVVYTAK